MLKITGNHPKTSEGEYVLVPNVQYEIKAWNFKNMNYAI